MSEFKTIADRYKYLREERTTNPVNGKYFTTRELSLAMTKYEHYSSRISRIENSKVEPNIDDLKRYREYFKVPYEFLLGETDSLEYNYMFVAQDLGLHDEAIKEIMQIFTWSLSGKFPPNKSPIAVLNFLLGFKKDVFMFLLYYILEYFELDIPDNVRSFDYTLPPHNRGLENASSAPGSQMHFKKCDPEEDAEFHLFKIQKNFIDLIKEIRQEKFSGGNKNG